MTSRNRITTLIEVSDDNHDHERGVALVALDSSGYKTLCGNCKVRHVKALPSGVRERP